MIPPHLFYQIYLSFLEQNDCTPPKCGELSEYTDSAHTEVEDLSSRCMNVSNVYDRCGHDTRLLHPSCTGDALVSVLIVTSISWFQANQESTQKHTEYVKVVCVCLYSKRFVQFVCHLTCNDICNEPDGLADCG